MKAKCVNEEESSERTFSEDEVRKILNSCIRWSKEPGRMCGNLDEKIRKLAAKHEIRLK